MESFSLILFGETQSHKLTFQLMAAAAGMRRLEQCTVSTHPTGLWSVSRFTVLPESGYIVMKGQTANNAPETLHQYRLEGGMLQKLIQAEVPCEHGSISNILGMMVGGQDLLGLACRGRQCGDIKLMNLETGETHVAYKSVEEPGRLCHGKEGRMWVHCRRDGTVKELNCSSKTFTETGRTVNIAGECFDMCYLPAPHSTLFLSHGYGDWVEAVSCETGKQLWRLEGEVDGKKMWPRGVTIHPEFQLLMVAEYNKERILVLNPDTGSPLPACTFPSPHPWHFYWSRGRLLVLHDSVRKQYISHLQLIDKEKGESCSALLLPKRFITFLVFYLRSGCCLVTGEHAHCFGSKFKCEGSGSIY